MLNAYRNRMDVMGSYEGEARRRNSQNIMDASWMRDAATKPVYVKWVESGLPKINDDDVPVYAKYNVKSYHNITGDEIAYLLQFRIEDIKNNSDIRIGSYVRIENEFGESEWWLLVHLDDRTQFKQFSIIKCTWIYRWVSEATGSRIIYECLGAPRKQNSYNSGVWLDNTTKTVENQEIFWVPTNSDTTTILYETKFLKSAPGRRPPLAWKVSKIEDTTVDGVSKFTMTQEMFDADKDNAELMIANYYESYVEPINNSDVAVNNLKFTYSGKPAVRAGGGYKKFTLKQYEYDELVDVTDDITWSIVFTDGSVDDLEYIEDGNIFKIKCLPNYSLIGKTFTVTAQTENYSKSIIVEVISL